jgi:hypothetical protein
MAEFSPAFGVTATFAATSAEAATDSHAFFRRSWLRVQMREPTSSTDLEAELNRRETWFCEGSSQATS